MASDQTGPRVIVLAKEPLPGRVKTRLAKDLGARRSMEVYRALVRDTFQESTQLEKHLLEVRYSPNRPSAIRRIRALLPPGASRRWHFRAQPEGTLGARLRDAFQSAFESGASAVLVLGTDCPQITRRDLKHAFKLLEGHDLVLGPATDGGYYLVGLRRPAPRIFYRIPWSTGAVFRKTIQRATALGLTVGLLRTLPDVDTIEDVKRLAGTLSRSFRRKAAGLPAATWKLLRTMSFQRISQGRDEPGADLQG